MEQPRVDLAALVQPVREYVVPILQECLAACVDRHEVAEGRGVDNYSFGTDAWSLARRRVQEEISDGTIPFQKAKERGFILLYNGIRLRHHKVGQSEGDPILASFPSYARGLAIEAAVQLSLFPIDGSGQSSEPVGIVYMANSEDGLCAVYLAKVGEVKNDRIVGWQEVVEVWRRDQDAGAVQAEVQTLVPPEESPTPLIYRRPKAQSDANAE